MIPSHAGVLTAGGHVRGVESARVSYLDLKSTILTNISKDRRSVSWPGLIETREMPVLIQSRSTIHEASGRWTDT